MATSEDGKERAIREKKFRALQRTLKKENPQIWKQLDDLIHEMQDLWRDNPFVGEEARGGKLGLSMSVDGKQRIGYSPLAGVFMFALLKQISDKFQPELKWVKKNKRVLEMMVNEYLAQAEHR
jgi:hypothetical protein